MATWLPHKPTRVLARRVAFLWLDDQHPSPGAEALRLEPRLGERR